MKLSPKRFAALCLAACLLLALPSCRDRGGDSGSAPSSSAARGLIPGSSAPASNEAPSASASSVPSSSAPVTQKITFAEGTTMAKMFMLLGDKGIADRDELFAAAEALDVSGYPLAGSVARGAGRCYPLEGYLFPDTYEFYVGDSPANLLKKMLDNGESRITAAYRSRAAQLGMTMDEIVILASLIQKEAGETSEMATVSSILHNRLAAGMRLQCDATISYVENVIVPFVENGRETYAATYNTYKCAALPAGPICNPGTAAIEAALWPADTDYYYFAMDADGNHYYSKTYEEHAAVCEAHGIGVHA